MRLFKKAAAVALVSSATVLGASSMASAATYNPTSEPTASSVPEKTVVRFLGHGYAPGETVDLYLFGRLADHTIADKNGEVRVGHWVAPINYVGQTVTFTLAGETSGARSSFPVTVIGPNSPVTPQSLEPVTLVSTQLTAVVPGQKGWQSIQWKGSTTNDVCDFKVIAAPGSGVTVAYPSNQTNTTPSKSTRLAKNDTDYTAVYLKTPGSVSGPVAIPLTVTYTPCGTGVPSGTAAVTLHLTTTLPVTANSGAAYTQDTDTVGPIAAGSVQDVRVYFTAKSSLTNFKLQVTNSDGVDVNYPAGRSYTTPSQESGIDALDSDYVGLRLNTEGLAPGTRVLQFIVSYGNVPTTQTGNLGVVLF